MRTVKPPLLTLTKHDVGSRDREYRESNYTYGERENAGQSIVRQGVIC